MNNNSQKIPEFLLKLRKLVDSPKTDKLIYWNQDGKGFAITDGHQLAREYFPLLFKHQNMLSFIRQLNMYGFHKINRIELGTNSNKGSCDDSEWSHPHFVRNRHDLLFKIQRKISVNPETLISENQNDPFKYELCLLKSAFRHLRNRDEIKMNKILDLERQNDIMRNELKDFRIQMETQSSWINEIYGSLSGYFPDNLKNALLYNAPIKRNLLALAPPSHKLAASNSQIESVINCEMKTSRIKVRKIELSNSEEVLKSVTKQEPISDNYPEDIYNHDYFVVNDNYPEPQDYDVDELLNHS